MTEKLQKVLARMGYGSRRQIEEWIRAGRIKVNAVTAKVGDRISPQAKITIDGQPIKPHKTLTQPLKVLLYHKPEGEICTRSDPEGRPTVFANLPKLSQGRWISIGRLDFNTSGLLLFCTDGELANTLMHPSSNIQREYAVRIYGEVEARHLLKLKQGVQLTDGVAAFDDIKSMGGDGKNQWYQVIVSEGKNRIVRRLWESQGFKVNRLMRIRFGFLSLPRSLRAGQFIELDSQQIEKLKIYRG